MARQGAERAVLAYAGNIKYYVSISHWLLGIYRSSFRPQVLIMIAQMAGGHDQGLRTEPCIVRV